MIVKTTDYSIFKKINGNRGISHSHVTKLTAAIARRNLLQLFPIIVNEKMEIVDGQHRLWAAKRLKLPIYYEKMKEAGLEEIHDKYKALLKKKF